MSEELLIDRRSAAVLLGICVRTLDSMVKAGEIPVLRVRRRVLFDKDVLRQWCKQGCMDQAQREAWREERLPGYCAEVV